MIAHTLFPHSKPHCWSVMSVLLETSFGDLVVDLHVDAAPRLAVNFLKLCALKYYNFAPFHRVRRDFIAESGDPHADGGRCAASLIDPAGASRFMRVQMDSRYRHHAR